MQNLQHFFFAKSKKKNRGSALEGYTTQESGRPFYTIITKFTLCLRCNFLEIIAMWSQFHTLSEFSHCVWKSQKCLGWTFQFWHFTPIFVLLKLTYVVTLFDHGFKFSKTLQIDHFWYSMNYSNEIIFVIFKRCVRIQTSSRDPYPICKIEPIEKTSLVVDASLMLLRGCKCVPFFNCNYFGTTLQNSNTKEMRKYRSS